MKAALVVGVIVGLALAWMGVSHVCATKLQMFFIFAGPDLGVSPAVQSWLLPIIGGVVAFLVALALCYLGELFVLDGGTSAMSCWRSVGFVGLTSLLLVYPWVSFMGAFSSDMESSRFGRVGAILDHVVCIVILLVLVSQLARTREVAPAFRWKCAAFVCSDMLMSIFLLNLTTVWP